MAVILALVVIVGPVASPVTAPLHVTSGSAQVDADGHHISVSASVANTTQSAQPGLVWWILSPPGQPPPWQHDVYHSALSRLRLPPNAGRTFTWREDALIPPGTYTLSVWVHRILSNGTEVHSEALDLVDVHISAGEGAAHLRRHTAPADGLAIAAASATVQGSTDPVAINGSATIANATNVASEPQLRWELVGVAPDGAWWSTGAAAETSNGSLAVAASSRAVDALHSDLALPLGRYALRLSLLEHGQVVDQVLLDQVTPVLDHWDPSVTRISNPSGPVVVERIATANTWTDGRTNMLDAAVFNRTDQTQTAQVGWVLGPPSDRTPWDDPDAALDVPKDIVLPPHGAAVVALSPQGAGALAGPGNYQLAVWVHVRDAKGALVHSDAASVAGGVTVPAWDPSVQRPRLPAGPVAVDVISAPVRWGDGSPVTVTLRNLSTAPQIAHVWWVLGSVGDSQPFNKPAATQQPQLELALRPGEVRQVALATTTPVTPGTYQLSIWVHVKASIGDFVHSDGAFDAKLILAS